MYIILNQLLFGLVALVIGLVVLMLLVHIELGPLALLTGHRRWLLTAALGSGVVAFGFKLALILLIAAYPTQFIDTPREVVSNNRITTADAQPAAARYRWLVLSDDASSTGLTSKKSEGGYVWRALPKQAPSPPDNPMSPAKVALGKQLFFDRSLSRDGTVSCATCHDVEHGAGNDGRLTARGINGLRGGRNTPTVWNAAFQAVLFWDGRASSLEAQASGPMLNPKEMGMPSVTAVEERVRQQAAYRDAFSKSFGMQSRISITEITQAIAAYERTLITADTPYDRFVGGELNALTPAQLRGMALFQSVGCINCHFGPNFSAASLFDSSVPLRPFPALPVPEEERYRLTRDHGAAGEHGERGVWRVPSLRNVALTGPWFHNGQVSKLKEAVRIMSRAQLGYGGHYLRWSGRDKRLSEIRTPALSDQQLNDLVAFLHALSSERLVALSHETH